MDDGEKKSGADGSESHRQRALTPGIGQGQDSWARGREVGDPIGTHIARCEAAGANDSGAGAEGRSRQGRNQRLSQLGHHCRVS